MLHVTLTVAFSGWATEDTDTSHVPGITLMHTPDSSAAVHCTSIPHDSPIAQIDDHTHLH